MPEQSITRESIAKVPALSPEERAKVQAMFDKLDTNKDGKIDIEELGQAMKRSDLQGGGYEQRFFQSTDTDRSGELDFGEFVQYVVEHEKKLKLFFKNFDTNHDGKIDASEIQQSFKKLGVVIDKQEADKLVRRMDKDGTLKIDWNEWREFLLLHPSQSLQDIVHYWRHSTIIDIGDNIIVPDDFTETELKTGMWWRHLVAGGSAGAVSRTCTAPLDRLKVLLQVHGSSKNDLTISRGFKQMIKEGGVLSLWRGNFTNVIKIAPESALKFMAYEQIKALFKGDKDEIGIIERLLSGSLAGATAQTVIYPMEVLKTRLCLRKTGQYKGIFDCAMKIYKHEGLASFYRGYIPNLLGIIPYAGIDLAVYETLKKMYIARNKDQDPGILALLACGTISSTTGQLASYPLALVRTRLQAQAASGKKKDSMTGLFKHILKHDGPSGLYRGIAPNFLKVAPAVSISYVVYEHTRKILGVGMNA